MDRNSFIDMLCCYWRPDYHIVVETKTHPHEGGLTESQQHLLRRHMERVFDTIIAPHMEFKK